MADIEEVKSHDTRANIRTSSGLAALIVFLITVVLIVLAFSTPYWLKSDTRIYSSKFDKLGLWVHCFRSLGDPNDAFQRRFFAGCRWVYNPFTTGYADIRGYLMPPWFVAVQFFFTVSFILLLIAAALVLMYILCVTVNQLIKLLKFLGLILVVASGLGILAVIIFGACANDPHWMPDPDHNYLHWSYGLATIGVVTECLAGVLFLVEAQTIKKKLENNPSAAMMMTEEQVQKESKY